MQPQTLSSVATPSTPPPGDWSFAVDPAELDTFVQGVRGLEETMAKHITTFESLHLDSGVFGRLPGISSKVHKAYSDHVDEGTKAFDEGKTVLHAAADRGAESAASYRDVEKRNIEALSEVTTLLELGNLRRAGRRVLKEA